MTEDACENAPRELQIWDYVAARAQEVLSLSRLVGCIDKTTCTSQAMPTHMRRRAASHNIKRLPRRLRPAACRDLERLKQQGARVEKPKRPSRKHRRRPSNLLQAYIRRRRKHAWLETHIWHAKRFHMTDCWGYKLPLTPCDKGFRAAHRAIGKYCLMQDVSYLCCLEVVGAKENIVELFRPMCNKETGFTIASVAFHSGQREGHCFLYRRGKYPQGCLGPVSFIWRQTEPTTLWMWIHPAMWSTAWQELEEALGIKATTNEGVARIISDTLQICSLKDQLCRFRLTGPVSQNVLTDTLIKADVTSPVSPAPWWLGFKPHDAQWCHWSAVRALQSPSQAAPYSVIPLIVRDPRLFLPSRKAMPRTEQEEEWCLDSQRLLADVTSPLWEKSVRETVVQSKISDHVLNLKRHELLVPGSTLELGHDESRVPVMLLQSPGDSGSGAEPGRGSGWDLVVPAGWGRAFWVSLIYRGARAGGLLQGESAVHNQGKLVFPMEYPDTAAGQEMDKAHREKMKSKHDKRPPAKRVNYARLNQDEPFENPWIRLTGCELCDIWVLRERMDLKALDQACKCINSYKSKLLAIAQRLSSAEILQSCLVAVRLTMTGRGTPTDFSYISLPLTSDLVDMQNGGPVEPLKEKEKLSPIERPKKRRKNNKNAKRAVDFPHILASDGRQLGGSVTSTTREVLMKEMLTGVSRKRKLRIQIDKPSLNSKRSRPEETTVAYQGDNSLKTELRDISKPLVGSEHLVTQAKPVNGSERVVTDSKPVDGSMHSIVDSKPGDSIQVDDSIQSVDNSTSVNSSRTENTRKTIGFISHGQFALYRGVGQGTGFIKLSALIDLLNEQTNRYTCRTNRGPLVLTRQLHSRQYRFAYITVVT